MTQRRNSRCPGWPVAWASMRRTVPRSAIRKPLEPRGRIRANLTAVLRSCGDSIIQSPPKRRGKETTKCLVRSSTERDTSRTQQRQSHMALRGRKGETIWQRYWNGASTRFSSYSVPPCQIEEMKHVPHSDTNSGRKTVILAPEMAISVHKTRQIRHIQRIKRTQRILLKLLAGIGPSRVAREERVSRATVWRYRRRVRQLVPIVRRMMRDAARRQDWRGGRLWAGG